eukprot:scaffold25318_cov117-Isochrysis_galbana.AAC.10
MSHAAAWASGAKTWARRVPRVAPMSGMRARRWRAGDPPGTAELSGENSRKSQLGRSSAGIAKISGACACLLGFWALGRHAVPSICTRKTIGR